MLNILIWIEYAEEKYYITEDERKAIKEHIELGNKEFEVRSEIPQFKIKKGDIIHISEYEVKYKFK